MCYVVVGLLLHLPQGALADSRTAELHYREATEFFFQRSPGLNLGYGTARE